MRYSHFSKTERLETSVLLKRGCSHREIGSALGKHHSSVSREIELNSVNGEYDPHKAQHKAYVKRKYSKYQGMKIRKNHELEKFVGEKLSLGWTPDEICGRLKLENRGKPVISFKSVYKWLDTIYGAPYRGCLASRQARWRRRKKGKKVIIKNRVGIEQRPNIINQRKRLGDFECDVLGSPKSEPDRLAGMADRQSRYFDLRKMKRLKEAVPTFKLMLFSNNGLSCTLDNGPENASHQRIPLPVFFCRPYAAWEKGTIENSFQRLRRYIPKKSRVSSFSDEQISAIVDRMNNTPRKCLGYKTPKEVFSRQPTRHSFNYSLTECRTSG